MRTKFSRWRKGSERQGASFYQEAAGVFKDATAVKEMLAGLSAMEVGHEKLFTGMRSRS